MTSLRVAPCALFDRREAPCLYGASCSLCLLKAQTREGPPTELPLVDERTLDTPVLDETAVTEALDNIHPFLCQYRLAGHLG